MDLSEVGFCGLYCGLCASRRRIPAEAARLRGSLHAEGYDAWFGDVHALRDAFPAFWETLGRLSENACPGCRAGGGYPPCPIRACARERQAVLCNGCAEFPCARFDLVRRYPTCLSDNERMLRVGLERWIAEQEERAARGVVYADLRYPDERAGE
jgi:hypothetical protein